MRIHARLVLVSALVAFATSLSACSFRLHRRGTTGARAAPQAGVRPLGARGDDRNCCPLYEVCLTYEGGMTTHPPVLVCHDCEGQHCVPIGPTDPCWRPPPGFPPVRSVRIGPRVFHCRCECLRKIDIRVTPAGIFVDLYPCEGPPCLHRHAGP
jgi:hypothetical protein